MFRTFALRAKIEAQAPTPHNLPQPPTALVGRDHPLGDGDVVELHN